MEDKSEFIAALTPDQRETLKIMLSIGPRAMERVAKIAEEDERREWLFTLIRKTAAWVFGIVAALVVFRDNIAALFRGGP
jgi:uncharacterized membrane protein AbrB (regulator of aidB expression)